MVAPTRRLLISSVLFSAWMGLLFFGHTAGGAVYLLLFAALVLFPWKSLGS